MTENKLDRLLELRDKIIDGSSDQDEQHDYQLLCLEFQQAIEKADKVELFEKTLIMNDDTYGKIVTELQQQIKQLQEELDGCRKFSEGAIDGYDEVKAERDFYKQENQELKGSITNKNRLIKNLKKIQKQIRKQKTLWFNLYHGLIPREFIGVKKEDWLKIINERKELKEKAEKWDKGDRIET